MGGGPLTLNPRNRKARDIELEVSEPATGRVEFPLIGTDRKRVEGLDVACIIPLLQACPGDETESLFACADRTRKGFVCL
jgi:hypothetical protein